MAALRPRRLWTAHPALRWIAEGISISLTPAITSYEECRPPESSQPTPATAMPGYSGDGGPATAASLNINIDPVGLAVDTSGNIYIADSPEQSRPHGLSRYRHYYHSRG